MVSFELSTINRKEFSRLGLSIINGIYDGVTKFDYLNPPLSTYDILFLNTSIQNGYVCATNDYNLQHACRNNNLSVLWVMDLIVMLNSQKYLYTSQAKEFLIKYKKRNNKFSDELFRLYDNRLS